MTRNGIPERGEACQPLLQALFRCGSAACWQANRLRRQGADDPHKLSIDKNGKRVVVDLNAAEDLLTGGADALRDLVGEDISADGRLF